MRDGQAAPRLGVGWQAAGAALAGVVAMAL